MPRKGLNSFVGLVWAAVLVAGVGDLQAKSVHGIKRVQREKPQITRVHEGLESGSFMLKFKDDLGVYVESGRLYYSDGRPVTFVNRLIDDGEVSEVVSEFQTDRMALRTLRRTGETRTLTALADLTQYYRALLPSGYSVNTAADLCDRLNRSSEVELAFLEGKPEVAGDVTPATPDFEPQQDYLHPAPGGVDAYAAWSYPGGRGDGVTICDIEVGWHTNHEDLSKLAGNIIGGDAGPDDHGTAVMGEMLADSSVSSFTGIGYGVTGISHGASGKMVTVALRSTANALLLAAENLQVGDLILIELHQPGPNSTGQGQVGFVPMEWTPSIFDVIQTISANGIIVCEAAGNGGEDLDDAVYGSWFDTTFQHSGAILCGAGAPPSGAYGPDRSRLAFSNHGERVDLQGYGNGVVTTGYGGLFNPGDDDQAYTATFSGTSSASPIVTASVACIQGRFKNVSGGYTMTAKEIRDLLYATGSPQTGATSQHIGPRPDLGAAMPLVTALSAYATPRTFNVSLIGEPMLMDTLWLVNPHGAATIFNITIEDSLPIPPVAALILPDSKAQLKPETTAPAESAPAAKAAWVSVFPATGLVPAGGSVPVEVTFDGNQLTGSYFGSAYKGRLNVEVNGDAGFDTLPVPILALAQDSLHGDTIQFVTADITHRATSETNLSGWDYNDASQAGWLFDASFVAGRVALGDTSVYRDVFGNAKSWRARDFWEVDSSWLPGYLIWRDSTMSSDSVVGLAYEAWLPLTGDSADFVFWRTSLYARSFAIPNLYFGMVGDWDLPASTGSNNFGGFDTTRQMVYQTGNSGFENFAAGFALLGSQAHGAVIGSNPADVYPAGGFLTGRLYEQMSTPGFRVDASNIDLHALLTPVFDQLLLPGEVIQREMVVLSSQTGIPGLEAAYARATQLSDSLRYLTCPIGLTGDVNIDGARTSADIILMVNFVFKAGDPPQPIEMAADVDCSGAVTSADIIGMVNFVFKGDIAPCDACTIY